MAYVLKLLYHYVSSSEIYGCTIVIFCVYLYKHEYYVLESCVVKISLFWKWFNYKEHKLLTKMVLYYNLFFLEQNASVQIKIKRFILGYFAEN